MTRNIAACVSADVLISARRENACRSVLVCVRMITGSMGCGGSRSAAIEPRYYESRDTESTWLTSTDTETQRAAAGNGTGESASENEKTAAAAAAAGSAQREEKPMTGTRGSSAKEKKLVNTGTQCGRRATLTDSTQRRPAHRDEVKSKSKKIPQPEGVKSVRPAGNAEVIP